MTHYVSRNKAGRLLARRIRGYRNKAKIGHLYHHATGTKAYSPQDIADTFSDSYGSLYNLEMDMHTPQPTPTMTDNFLDQVNFPRLSDAQLQKLNAPFTIPEISKIIGSLPCNKSPGPDGYTGEYYKAFRDLLSPYLCGVFKSAAAKFSLPP